jgi:hypothetical protein
MSLSTNWRTINIDALDPESPANFDLSSLTPSVPPTSSAECQATAQQVRQLLRGGDSEGALRGALDTTPYGADERGKVRAFRKIFSVILFGGIFRISQAQEMIHLMNANDP